jgi:hypothetical protein
MENPDACNPTSKKCETNSKPTPPSEKPLSISQNYFINQINISSTKTSLPIPNQAKPSVFPKPSNHSNPRVIEEVHPSMLKRSQSNDPNRTKTLDTQMPSSKIDLNRLLSPKDSICFNKKIKIESQKQSSLFQSDRLND